MLCVFCTVCSYPPSLYCLSASLLVSVSMVYHPCGLPVHLSGCLYLSTCSPVHPVCLSACHAVFIRLYVLPSMLFACPSVMLFVSVYMLYCACCLAVMLFVSVYMLYCACCRAVWLSGCLYLSVCACCLAVMLPVSVYLHYCPCCLPVHLFVLFDSGHYFGCLHQAVMYGADLIGYTCTCMFVYMNPTVRYFMWRIF